MFEKSRRSFQKQQDTEIQRLSQCKMTKLERAQEVSSLDSLKYPEWPGAYVIHHPLFLQRFQLERRKMVINPRLPYLLDDVYHDSFDSFLLPLS